MKRLLIKEFRVYCAIGLFLALSSVLLCSGCSVMTKTAGAATGGAVGSLAGPLGGGVGAGAGYLISEIATEDDQVISGDLSPEVRAAIDTAMSQNRGFMENLELQVWAALRLIGGLALFSLIASVGYSLWRKRKASPFYDRIREIEKKLTD